MLQRQQSTHINCYTEDVKVYNPQTPSSVQMAVKALTVRDNVKNQETLETEEIKKKKRNCLKSTLQTTQYLKVFTEEYLDGTNFYTLKASNPQKCTTLTFLGNRSCSQQYLAVNYTYKQLLNISTPLLHKLKHKCVIQNLN